jgi:hypothetical protein
MPAGGSCSLFLPFIYYLSSLQWLGHIAANCRGLGTNRGFKPKKLPTDSFQRKDLDQGKHTDVSGWFQGSIGVGPSSPPVFKSFSEFWKTLIRATPAELLALCTDLVIYPSLPVTTTAPDSPLANIICSAPEMAFQTADPQPFMPRGFHRLEVQGRKHMARVVARREPYVNEDWAILSIEPLPQALVIFASVREVSLEFLIQHKRLQIRDIQRSHLGQALVRFVHIYDRDRLITQSPHPYGDVFFSFTKHNEGRNWRRLEYNREC